MQQHPEGAAGGSEHFGRVAALLPPRQCAVAQGPPAGGDDSLHAHRQNAFGIAVAFIGKVALGLVQCRRPADRPLGQRVVDPGDPCSDDGTCDSDPAQPGVDDEQNPQIQRHKGQIEQCCDRRPCQKTAHHIQIAQRLGRACRTLPLPLAGDARPGPDHKALGPGGLIQPQCGPRQQPHPQKIIKSQKAKQHDDNCKQAHQCRH